MVVNAEGSREAFSTRAGAIGEKLTLSDQLFINTTGHGGHHGHGRGPDLVTLSSLRALQVSHFCADLATCRRTARWWC